MSEARTGYEAAILSANEVQYGNGGSEDQQWLSKMAGTSCMTAEHDGKSKRR